MQRLHVYDHDCLWVRFSSFDGGPATRVDLRRFNFVWKLFSLRVVACVCRQPPRSWSIRACPRPRVRAQSVGIELPESPLTVNPDFVTAAIRALPPRSPVSRPKAVSIARTHSPLYRRRHDYDFQERNSRDCLLTFEIFKATVTFVHSRPLRGVVYSPENNSCRHLHFSKQLAAQAARHPSSPCFLYASPDSATYKFLLLPSSALAHKCRTAGSLMGLYPLS